MAGELKITYPVAYGIDFVELSRLTGAFYEKDRKFLHPVNILLRPDRTIAIASYSSGPIGRFSAQEVLRIVRFWKDQEKK